MGITAVPGVASPTLAGVKISRHPLEREAGRLNHIAHRVGQRLLRWIKAVEAAPHIELRRVIGRDPESGLDLTEQVLDANKQPVLVPVLPDEDFRRSWDLYERTIRCLLIEQRQRAILAPGKGGPPISDEEYERQLSKLARSTLLEMPKSELLDLLRERAIDVVTKAERGGVAEIPARTDDPCEGVEGSAPRSPGLSASGDTAALQTDILSGFDDDD